MKLAIVIPTYRKKDNTTYFHLKRALDSVCIQTHQDYKVFLIGDAYSDFAELTTLSQIIPSDKLYLENMKVPGERGKYVGRNLWVCGGVKASNIGINVAISQGFSYICHLDHDDWFLPNHLKLISDTIEITKTNFVSTRCGKGWPVMESTEYLTKWRPLPNKVFKVTTCLNYRYFNLRFRNMIETCNRVYASDADLWDRINKLMTAKNEWGYVINESTTGRGPGKTVIHNPNIV